MRPYDPFKRSYPDYAVPPEGGGPPAPPAAIPPPYINPNWGPGNEPGGLTAPPGTVIDPGSGQAGTWSYPDYQALIDAQMAPLTAQYGAANVADEASRNQAFQQAVIRFGELPDLNSIAGQLGLTQSNLGSILGNNIGGLAQGNTDAGTSTVARLNTAHTDAVRGIVNALASRGILHSGETGFQRGKEDTAYGTAQYDARNTLLDYLGGVQHGLTSAEQQRAAELAQARMTAANTVAQMYQPTWVPAGSAPPPPAAAPSSGAGIGAGAGVFGAPPPPANYVNRFHGYGW